MSRRERNFPKEVPCVDDLPLVVSGSVRKYHADPAIRRIILIPAHDYPIRRTTWLFELPFGWRLTPERTLVFGDEKITVVEIDRDGMPTTTAIPLETLIDIHLVEILLYAFVELTWIGAERSETMKIEYNLVGQTLIQRGIDQARAMLPPRLPPGSPTQAEASLADLPLMFRNYVRRSLLPAESLCAVVYQPGIRRAKDRFHRLISPNRTIAVTERCVLVIEDQRHRVHRRYAAGTDYAVVRHFYPLSHIACATFEPGAGALWLTLKLGPPALAQEASFPLESPGAEVLRGALRVQGINVQ